MSGRTMVAGTGGAALVLVVEDDPDIRQAMQELLQDEGYDCIFAKNGLEALETLSVRTPSLLDCLRSASLRTPGDLEPARLPEKRRLPSPISSPRRSTRACARESCSGCVR